MKPRSLKINFIINTLGSVAPLLIALVSVPLYMRQIGDARYGVLSIVWVLLGYFGFLDLGLSRASANALARLKDAARDVRAKVFVTALALNFGLGLLGSLCLATLGAYLLEHVLKIPETLKPEIAQAFPWIVCLFPLALVSGFGVGVLESRERFLLVNVIQVIGTAAGQIVPLALAILLSPTLAIVIPAAVVCRAMTMFALLFAVYHEESPFSLSAFDASQAKRLLSYGSWVTVSGVVSPILVSLDQFVIGAVLNVAALPHYVVPMNLISRSQLFAGALLRTLFPRMSSLGHEEAHKLAVRALSLLAFGYAAVCAPAMILTPVFFKYWISADFASSAAPVAEILFFGAWLNGLAFVPFGLLQGQGRPDITAKFHIVELAPFVAVLWGLTSVFGIRGTAAAWSLRCVVDAILMFWAAGMLKRKHMQLLLAPLALLLISDYLAGIVGQELLPALGAAALTFVAGATLAVASLPEARVSLLRLRQYRI